MSASDRPISDRLLDGAKKIAAFWRAGERCQTAGWSIKRPEHPESCEIQFDQDEVCKCGPKATQFCKGKLHWLLLAEMEPREIHAGEFGMAWTMQGSEWDATGLTLIWELGEVGKVRIGPKDGITMKDLKELMGQPLSALATLKLMKAFPGAKVEFEKEEEPKVVGIE